MIRVFFGIDWEAIRNPDPYFKYNWREEWFEDPLVKEMVKGVDETIVLSPHCMDSPILGQIPPERLSGGVKALILLLKADMDLKIDLVACGDNCSKWLSKIGSIKDISVSMSGYDLFFK